MGIVLSKEARCFIASVVFINFVTMSIHNMFEYCSELFSGVVFSEAYMGIKDF